MHAFHHAHHALAGIPLYCSTLRAGQLHCVQVLLLGCQCTSLSLTIEQVPGAMMIAVYIEACSFGQGWHLQ
eukprot:1159756-Pelagomonas_calceolata.AAC.19